jgi:glycerol kinase
MGLSRGSGRAAIARAMIDAMAFQVTDVMVAMAASPVAPTEIRVDGGAAANDLLLQLIADFTQLPVSRPRAVETTALGAATLAGLATGLWSSPADLAHLWHLEATFTPAMGADEAERRREIWRRAVDRSRRWATD